MKFGKSLSNQIEETLPEWRDKFLSYKELKRRLKFIGGGDRLAKRPRLADDDDSTEAAITREEEDFLRLLEAELEKFNAFFVEKEEEYIIRQKELQERVARAESKEELMEARKEIVDFHGEMVLLENYSALNYTDAEFRNTGLERSEKLAKDLEWFEEQGHIIPEPSSPGISYAHYLEELSEKNPQAFICHFYNVYFAHTAGGRMIGKKVAEKILNKKELEFYEWDGDLSQLLQDVRDKLNQVASSWSTEEKKHCLEETQKSFKYSGELLRLILS